MLSLRRDNPPGSFAAVPHRVVVVGGGFARATFTKYLKLWARDNIEVALVEPNPEHISCIMSNLVVNGRLTTGDACDHGGGPQPCCQIARL
jgi:hypothetical protein